jgi:lysozyme
MTNSSRRGLDLIKTSEGFRENAYPDPASGGDPWTIGYGFTKGVKRGDKITRADADARLIKEYDAKEADVLKLVKVPLTPNQLGALVSLTFNIGAGNLGKSTLLRKLNAGDYAGAAAQFAVWKFAAGKVMKGLVTRRANEAALFRKP